MYLNKLQNCNAWKRNICTRPWNFALKHP